MEHLALAGSILNPYGGFIRIGSGSFSMNPYGGSILSLCSQSYYLHGVRFPSSIHPYLIAVMPEAMTDSLVVNLAQLQAPKASLASVCGICVNVVAICTPES